MSERSGSSSDEGEGEQIRPYGDDQDSSEESAEDDPEELKRIAQGFIVDEDEDEDDDGSDDDLDPAERRRRKKEAKKRRKQLRKEKRAQRAREEAELSEDDLDLLNENRGFAGPSKGRPAKRARRGSGSDGDDDLDMGDSRDKLQDMFADDEDRDEDDDDLGDFIEEDEEPMPGETEEERRERRREEKLKRREAARSRPDVAGVDRAQWDEIHEVFGDGTDYQYALDEEADEKERSKEKEHMPKVELEDVFDPAEIKARRLGQEDIVVQSADRPERHQFVNSSLSDNPIPSSDLPFPDPARVTERIWDKISPRTGYLFCGIGEEGSYPGPGSGVYLARRLELKDRYAQAVTDALDCMFVKQYEVPYLWHYKRDQFAHLENEGRTAVQLLERDELWTLYTLGVRFQAIHARVQEARELFDKIKEKRPAPPASVDDSAREGQVDENGESKPLNGTSAPAQDPYVAKDAYLENELLNAACLLSMEAAADAIDWLEWQYATEVKQIREDEAMMADAEGKRKLPERQTIKDLRDGAIMQLVKAFGVDVERSATLFNTPGSQPTPLADPTKMPLEMAEEFAGLKAPFATAEEALSTAVQILTIDFTKNPVLRQQVREFVKECTDVTITPTERGMTVIDRYHAYYTFKFLTNKPARDFIDTPQWLHILKAEEEGLITVNIRADDAQVAGFVDALVNCCQSADYGEVATAWNTLRRQICSDAATKYLMPQGTRWVKEHLRKEAEEYVAERCRMELEFRVNVRPYMPDSITDGSTPSVLAVTNGKGELRDAIIAVHLDVQGQIRSQTKFDRLSRPNPRAEGFDAANEAADADIAAFINIFRRNGELRKRGTAPMVVVVGGMSVRAHQLKTDIHTILRGIAKDELYDHDNHEREPDSLMYADPEQYQYALRQFEDKLLPYATPVIMPNDATARLYMDSDEAKEEHPGLPSNGRYALALARYTQNPLNAYAKLGKRLLDVTFMEHHQRLIGQDKLLLHLERGLVNSVCAIGLNFFQSVQEPYMRTMLPFIAGLGPRKADAVCKAYLRQPDDVINRRSLQTLDILPITTWENAIGFLTMDWDLTQMSLDEEAPETQPDPLDTTRIHPEHYQMAQKMCQDTLDMDAEDREGQHPSDVVLKLMLDGTRERRLAELNLDDFAWGMVRQGGNNHRHTLGEMVRELIDQKADRRPPFYVPNSWEVLTMLTGETERTVGSGLIVTATVRKVMPMRAFCSLESGIDAVLEREFVQDLAVESCIGLVHERSAVKAVVLDIDPARFKCRISLRPADLAIATPFVQPFAVDRYNNQDRQNQAEYEAAAKKRRQAGKVKRIIQHPKWQELKSGQAEQFLASQPKGEVVIRPSSKGSNYLALTFKLDEDIFQHLDIEEIDKPNEYSLGEKLLVAGRYLYHDLDDIIVNYVMAVMSMLEQAERHEKFKPEAELENFLKNTLLAFPNRSMYAFSIDSEHPGSLKLAFLNKSTKDGGVIRTWRVRLLPGAYQLGKAEVPGMLELCNAFKTQYSTQLADQGAGGKTPGIRAGRTPAVGSRTPAFGGRTPAPGMQGGRTPMPPHMQAPMGGQTPYGQANPVGRTPMRPGMTPNPYGQSRDPRHGGATPAQAYGYQQQPPPPPPAGQGYGMPPPPPGMPTGPPRGAPAGMNPERAAMLARQGGNGY